MRVAPRARPVDAARGERAAEHLDRRVDRLQRLVRAERSARYAGAAASVPSGLNCGSQKRFRFGSLPMMKFWRSGTELASSAACCAKLACASGGERGRLAAEVVDRDVDLDPVELAPPRSASSGGDLARRRVGVQRVPDRRHAHRVQAGELEQVELRLRLRRARAP